jgi:hypothetical protein
VRGYAGRKLGAALAGVVLREADRGRSMNWRSFLILHGVEN